MSRSERAAEWRVQALAQHALRGEQDQPPPRCPRHLTRRISWRMCSSMVQTSTRPGCTGVSRRQHALTFDEPASAAGPEVCGRAISVYHKALSGWLEGRVTQFDPELSLHLVEYDCTEGQEIAPEWLRLCSERPWQWLDERASDAEPNPTSVGRVFDESIVNMRIRILWPSMQKWYLGTIVSFDAATKHHVVHFKDGDQADYDLKHEAVVWLNQAAAPRVQPKSPKRGGSQARGGARRRPARGGSKARIGGAVTGAARGSATGSQRSRRGKDSGEAVLPVAAPTSAAPLVEAAAVSEAPAGITVVDLTAGSAAPAAPRRGPGRPPGRKAGGPRSSKPVASRRRAQKLSDDDFESPEEEFIVSDDDFSDMSIEFEELIQSRGSELPNSGSRCGRQPMVCNPARPRNTAKGIQDPALAQCLKGIRVAIHWEDDETFYRGELISYNDYQKNFKVMYDDGEDEWTSLHKEVFRWVLPRGRTNKAFSPQIWEAMRQLGAIDLLPDPPVPTAQHIPCHSFTSTPQQAAAGGEAVAALPAGEERPFPEGAAAVGWTVSVLSVTDGAHHKGEVLAFDAATGRQHVLYSDGEDERLLLHQESVQWHELQPERRCYTVGLPEGEIAPSMHEAVHWRIAVFWRKEQEFFMGDIVNYDPESDVYEVHYDDGETCEVNLVTDVIKWILPPGLRSTMAPELMDESDREYRPCLNPSSRGRLMGSGCRGRVQGRSDLFGAGGHGVSPAAVGLSLKSASLPVGHVSALGAQADLHRSLTIPARASPLAGSPLVPLSPYAAGALPVRPRTPLMGPSAGPPILEMTVPLAAASRRLEGLGGTVVRIYCSDLAEEHGSRHLQSLSQGSPAASGRVSLGPDEAAAAAAQFAKAVAEGKAAAAAAGGDCRPPAAAGGSSAHEPSAPAEAAAAVQGPDGPTPAAPAGSGGSAVGLAALVDSSAAAQAPGGAACAVVGRQSPAPAAAGGEAPAGQAPTELPAPPAVPEARPAPLAVPEARPAGPQAQARNSSPSASAAPGAAGAPQGARSVSPAVAGREVSLGPVAMHMQAPVAANKGAASAIKTDPEGAQRTWPDSVPVPQQGASGESCSSVASEGKRERPSDSPRSTSMQRRLRRRLLACDLMLARCSTAQASLACGLPCADDSTRALGERDSDEEMDFEVTGVLFEGPRNQQPAGSAGASASSGERDRQSSLGLEDSPLLLPLSAQTPSGRSSDYCALQGVPQLHQRVPQLRPCSAPSSAAPARRPAVAVAAPPASQGLLGVRVRGSGHASPAPLSPLPSPSSRGPMRTPGTFQRLGSASWGSFGGSIQSTARSGSGSSSSLSSVLLQQPSRLSVVTAAQRRGEKAHLLFGDSSVQASPWSSGYLNGGLKSEEMKSEELAEEGCFQHKGFNGMPSAADVLARVNPGGGALRKGALSAAAQLLAQDSVGLPDTPSLGGEDRDKLAAALSEQLGSRACSPLRRTASGAELSELSPDELESIHRGCNSLSDSIQPVKAQA